MKKILFGLCLIITHKLFAGTVDTVSILSKSMRKNIKCVVIKPDSYKKGNTTYPTVYLLHGHGGRYDNWIKRVEELKQHADNYQLLIVCPDGAVSSWYFNSPVDTTMRYESFVASEVPVFIDSKYRTIKNRNARAITGLSMGGHGGLFLGFRHADFFGACGSMSGALAIEYITSDQYSVNKRLGDTANKERYREYSIMKQMENYPKDSIAIIMDCGTEDFIIEMSRIAHQKMLALKIPHDYIERPGKHDWKYWTTAIEYQLLFFNNYFRKKARSL
ncbi:MAG TPA: alpha/beta hydrolase-fold protein [Chitinophagaceae bacterium]|nr:alpha/beta hydrolase-fold protein [Chitinophagaceae bacterium]